MPFLREKLSFHDHEREGAQIRTEERAEARAIRAEGRAKRRAQEERRILKSRREAEVAGQKAQELQMLESTAASEGVVAPYQEEGEAWGVHGKMKRRRSLLDPELTVDDKTQQLTEALNQERTRRRDEERARPLIEAQERADIIRRELPEERAVTEPTTVGGYEEQLTILKGKQKRVLEAKEKSEKLDAIVNHAEVFIGKTLRGVVIDTPEELIQVLKENRKTSEVTLEVEDAIYAMDWPRIQEEGNLPGVNDLDRELTAEEMTARGIRKEAPEGYETISIKEKKELSTKDDIIRKIAEGEELSVGEQKLYDEIIKKQLSVAEKWSGDLAKFKMGEFTEEEMLRMYPQKRDKIKESTIPSQPIRVKPLKVGNWRNRKKAEYADQESVDFATGLKTIDNVMTYFDNMNLLEKDGINTEEINDYIMQVVIPGMTIEQKKFLAKKGYIEK